MTTIVLTGKSGSGSSASSISLIPSLSVSIFITCRVSQARNEDARWAKATCEDRLPRLVTAIEGDVAVHVLFRGLIGHTSLTADQHLKAPPRNQQAEGTHSVPATSQEQPQLQATPGTQCPRSGRAQALPVPSCLQIPSVSLTSDCTFFLGRILGQLPTHTSFIVSASCCHRKDTGDGWRWGPTTEQMQVLGLPSGCTASAAWQGGTSWQSQAKEPLWEPVLPYAAARGRRRHLTPCIHLALSSTVACTGCFECCTKCILG